MAARRYAISTGPQQWERRQRERRERTIILKPIIGAVYGIVENFLQSHLLNVKTFLKSFFPFSYFPFHFSLHHIARAFSCELFMFPPFNLLLHIPHSQSIYSSHLNSFGPVARTVPPHYPKQIVRYSVHMRARVLVLSVFPSHEISFTRRQPKSGGVVVAAEKAKKGNSIWARVMSNAEKLKNKFVVSRTAYRSQVPTLYINKMLNGNRLKFPVRFIQSRSAHNVSTAQYTESRKRILFDIIVYRSLKLRALVWCLTNNSF